MAVGHLVPTTMVPHFTFGPLVFRYLTRLFITAFIVVLSVSSMEKQTSSSLCTCTVYIILT